MPLYTNENLVPETEKRLYYTEQVLDAALNNGASPTDNKSFLETLSAIHLDRVSECGDLVRVKATAPQIPCPPMRGEHVWVKYDNERKYNFRSIRILFEPRDAWIGAYWTFQNIGSKEIKAFKIYICLVPFLPIVLTWTNSFIE